MTKHLLGYSAMATVVLASSRTHAQVSYTDVDPDDVLDLSHGVTQNYYYLDLDNDGTSDLLINNWLASSRNTYWGAIYLLQTSQSNAIEGAGANSFYQVPIAFVLNSGDAIGSANEWEEGGVMLLYYDHRWLGQSNKYFGVKFQKADGTHYGWVRLSVSESGNQIYVSDYAYELQPNTMITAGQKSPCGDGFEPNNFLTTAKAISDHHDYYALISSKTDVDLFMYNLEFPNIRITLNAPTAHYNIKLYNSAGRIIGKSAKNNLANDTIVVNNLSSGNYAIKVDANGKFSATDCYSLKVEASATAFKQEEQLEEDVQNIMFELYPNPAQDQLTVKFSQEISADQIMIVDMTGRIVKEKSQHDGCQLINFDVSDLRAGLYQMRVRVGNELVIKKFVKE